MLHVAVELQLTAHSEECRENDYSPLLITQSPSSSASIHCMALPTGQMIIGQASASVLARATSPLIIPAARMAEMLKDAFQSPTSTPSNCSHALYVHIITVADENDQATVDQSASKGEPVRKKDKKIKKIFSINFASAAAAATTTEQTINK